MDKSYYWFKLALEGEREVIDQFRAQLGLGFQLGDPGIASSREVPGLGFTILELFTHEGTQDEANVKLRKWIEINQQALSGLRNINKTISVDTVILPKHGYSWFMFTPETIRAVSLVNELYLTVMMYKTGEPIMPIAPVTDLNVPPDGPVA